MKRMHFLTTLSVLLVMFFSASWATAHLPASASITPTDALLACGTPVNISNSSGYSWYPAIWVEPSGTVHAVWWEEGTPGDPNTSSVWYARKAADGSWSAAEVVSTLYRSIDPVVAVDLSGTVHVAWAAEVPNFQVWYASKSPGGNWTSPVQVTSAPGSGGAGYPDFAVGPDGVLHLVYSEHPGGPWEVYHRSNQGGGSWSAAENISNTPGGSEIPSLAIDSAGNLQVIWLEDYPNGRTYGASKPVGGSWSAAEAISAATELAWLNDLGVDSQGTWHAVWHQGGGGAPTIYYASRPSGGAWTAPAQVSDVVGIRPAMAVDMQDTVHVFWGGLSYARKPLGGIWSVQAQVAQPGWYGNIESQPALGIDALGTLHLVWNSNPADNAETWYVSCTSFDMATSTPTATDTQTPTPTDTPTVMPTDTATFTPTNTPTLMPTPTPQILTVSLESIASEDGWVVESSETSNQGGSFNATATTFRVGDDGLDRQIRSILSFDTSSLPDDADILSAALRLKRQGLAGTSPFSTHGPLWADVKNGAFGDIALQPSDFQNPASRNRAARMSEPLNDGDLSVGRLNPSVLPFINRTGRTQIRLRFNLDDNDDLGADRIGFFSGDASVASDRPVLIVTYTVP